MHRLFRLTVILIALIVVAACSPEEELLPTPTSVIIPTATIIPTNTPLPVPTVTPRSVPRTIAEKQEDQSYLRMVHAISGLPSVDIFVDTIIVAADLNYTQYTGATRIVGGEYTLSVLPRGGFIEGNSNPILQQSVSIPDGKTVILVLGGTVDVPVLIVYQEDDNSLETGQSRVTLIHAIPQGPSLTLKNSGVDLSPESVVFSQQITPLIIDSESTMFTIHDSSNVLTSYQIDLRERRNYTLIVVGTTSNIDRLSIIEFYNDVAGFADVRAINASPSIGALDFYINDSLIANNVEYPRISQRQKTAGGFYNINVFLAGADPTSAVPFASRQINAYPGDIATIIVTGAAEDLQIGYYLEELSPLARGQARVTFISTVDSQTIRLIEGDEEVNTIGDLVPGQFSPTIMADEGTHTYYWHSVALDRTISARVETAENIQFEAGNNYLYLVTGRDDGSPPVIFSDDVGVDERLLLIGDEPVPTLAAPTNIRLVNALADGAPLDYFVDGLQAASSLEYAQITAPIAITAGSHLITVKVSGQTREIASLNVDLMSVSDYTIYTYGSDPTLADMMFTQNPDLVENNSGAYVRLVNANTDDNILFDLAYAEVGRSFAAPTVDPYADPNREGSVSSSAIGAREPLYGGAIIVASDVHGGHFSHTIALPSMAADFFVIDSSVDMVAAKFFSLQLEPGSQYDVIAYQSSSSDTVIAVAILYKTQP
jgi:hypothetical protein